MELIPVANSLFNSNFTATSVSNALWQAQGLPPSSNNCADQANLLDVAPALDVSMARNRTTWAQAALLWNLALSENVTATQELQSFIQRADWRSLGTSDGPTTDPSSRFAIEVSGFHFDFAAQTVDVPQVTFMSDGQPTTAQQAQVNNVAANSLDRMYSFALGACSVIPVHT